MKRLILSLLIVINALQGFSEGINSEDAKLVSEIFLKGKTKTAVTANEAVVFQNSEVPLTYVVNFKPEGWALVSADDRAPAILAYSDNGHFDTEEVKSLPFYYWFEGYADQISALVSSKAPEVRHSSWKEIETSNYTKAVEPVEPLIQVLWDQDSGWNKYCPTDADGPGGHAYAGCVAVAMAQCMSVYQHPTQGYGSHSYTAESYGTQYANFGETIYDWANMANQGATDAVALLLYHLGISVNMGYAADGSGAMSSSVPGAIKSYFDYSNSAKYISKSDYTAEGEWESILIDQLHQGYPIYYSGDAGDNQPGHAFNIDGVSAQGAFHFNFGWSGSYNGYYFVTSINPGSHDFTSNQGAVINFMPRAHAPQDISLANNTVEEGMPIGTIVGKIIVTDETPEDTFTFLVSGTVGFDGEPVSVPFTEQEGNLVTTEVLDYNNRNRYEVVIKVTDKTNLSFEKNVFVNVDDNSAPTNITITNKEFYDTLAVGSLIGVFNTTDQDAEDTFVYGFETNENPEIGKDNDKFIIQNDSLITNYDFSSFDGNQCSIYIKSSDKKNESVMKEILLTVNKVSGFLKVENMKEVTVFPNPSNDGIYSIDMSKYLSLYNGSKYIINIYDLQGRLQKTEQNILTQDELIIKMEKKGMYILHLIIDGDQFNQKIIYR